MDARYGTTWGDASRRGGAPLAWWVRGSGAGAAARRARRGRRRRSPTPELAPWLLLLGGWILLWSFFLLAVVEPAAGLGGG